MAVEDEEPSALDVVGKFLGDLAILTPRLIVTNLSTIRGRVDRKLAEKHADLMALARDYDRARAHQLAICCKQAYFRPSVEMVERTLRTRYSHFELVSLFDKPVSDDLPEPIPIAFIAQEDDELIVVARGTRELRDIVIQYRGLLPFESRGDSTAYSLLALRLLIAINEKIRKSPRKFRRAWITGHSMGGAVAAILGKLLANARSIPTVLVYTFAPPPSMGRDSAALSHVWRLRRPGDFIPFFHDYRYAHQSTDYLLDTRGRILKLDDSREARLLELAEATRLPNFARRREFYVKYVLTKIEQALDAPDLSLDSVMVFDRAVQTNLSGFDFFNQHGIDQYVELLGGPK